MASALTNSPGPVRSKTYVKAECGRFVDAKTIILIQHLELCPMKA